MTSSSHARRRSTSKWANYGYSCYVCIHTQCTATTWKDSVCFSNSKYEDHTQSTKPPLGYSITFTQARKIFDCSWPRLDMPEGFCLPMRWNYVHALRPRTTSTTSRAAPPSSDHIDHGPRRPRPERLRRAPTTSTTRPRRNDDCHKERRYDNRDHRHNRPKSTRTGQLYRHRPDFYPKISTLLI